MAVSTQNGNGIIAMKAIGYLIPVIEPVVDRVVVQKNERHVFRCGLKHAIHPDNVAPGYVPVAHSDVRTGRASQETNPLVVEHKFVAPKNGGEPKSAAFTPACIM